MACLPSDRGGNTALRLGLASRPLHGSLESVPASRTSRFLEPSSGSFSRGSRSRFEPHNAGTDLLALEGPDRGEADGVGQTASMQVSTR